MKPIPHTAKELIEQLDADLPPRPPRLSDSDRMVWHDVGQRALIDNLKLRLAKTLDAGKLLEG